MSIGSYRPRLVCNGLQTVPPITFGISFWQDEVVLAEMLIGKARELTYKIRGGFELLHIPVTQSSIPVSCRGTLSVCRFMADFNKFVEEKDSALSQMRAKNQQNDDDNSHLIDEVTSRLTETKQKAEVKQRSRKENGRRIQHLQAQVGYCSCWKVAELTLCS